jgi:hypothetical protein
MKRKYDCPKVRIGDWVYACIGGCLETKYSYKVVRIDLVSFSGNRMITVEVGNKKDSFIEGWRNKSIGNGQYWNVTRWMKAKGLSMEIE